LNVYIISINKNPILILEAKRTIKYADTKKGDIIEINLLVLLFLLYTIVEISSENNKHDTPIKAISKLPYFILLILF